MELIDKDALMLKVCGEGCGCMPDECGFPCCDINGKEKRCKTGEYVITAPTIDAIPVEWLRRIADDDLIAPPYRFYAQAFIDMWAQEKGVDD